MAKLFLLLIMLYTNITMFADIIIYNPTISATGRIFVSIDGNDETEIYPNHKLVYKWDGSVSKTVKISGDVNRTFFIQPTNQDVYIRTLRDIGIFTPSIITNVAIVDNQTGKEETSGLLENNRYDEFISGLRLGVGGATSYDGNYGIGLSANVEYLYNKDFGLHFGSAWFWSFGGETFESNEQFSAQYLNTHALALFRFDRVILGYTSVRLGLGAGYIYGNGEEFDNVRDITYNNFNFSGITYIGDLSFETSGFYINDIIAIFGFRVSYDDLSFSGEDISRYIVNNANGPDFGIYGQLHFNLWRLW